MTSPNDTRRRSASECRRRAVVCLLVAVGCVVWTPAAAQLGASTAAVVFCVLVGAVFKVAGWVYLFRSFDAARRERGTS